MKIALLGYGRMGKTIEKLAENRGHSIVYKTSSGLKEDELKKADVAIDFSIPEAAFKNITTCFQHQIPVVCGTTGWLEKYDEAVKICKKENAAFIYASNFSLGVNLFFELNTQLAKLMKKFDQYKVDVEEIHHTKKLDKPSGTAITLTEQILANSAYTNWELKEENTSISEKTIPVTAKRIEDVPGTHIINYASDIDDIEIKHTAHSREGFALGAIIAAEFLKDKTGIFTMKDVLNV
ncbi:4-hydroxy-tetrahydrodipicolinate reductase [Mesonia maritima]|uniref:4-hydroxy-tetrahydrodipicolinate reductase n=1 Tax=Mesonia maritima TaxID=1793873 RepID=A0ABU1K3V2_9FLAO|nr:4-hydroxy-tetrahydrodipicolinate reductase [Mesonia maritima]MDR6300279.1 4-hydroxy-tetrahydrodipicolinate reductase [Mesonia maritima]